MQRTSRHHNSGVEQSIDKLLAENDRQQEQIARRLQTSDVLNRLAQQPWRIDNGPDLWRYALEPPAPVEVAPIHM